MFDFSRESLPCLFSVMEVAQTKAQLHETMEMKDTELQEIRSNCQTLKQEKEELNQKVQQLEQNSECNLQGFNTNFGDVFNFNF